MFKRILLYFFTWRIALFFVAFLSIYFLPTFGGRFPYADRVLEITHLPNFIWGFGNFDGVHYLRIAQNGYSSQYSQAFFPLFPLLVRFFSFVFPHIPNLDTNVFTDPAYFYSGLILSNIFFLVSLFVFYKLIKLDFKENIVWWSIFFLLVFPTSFYFGAVYTESLFLLLAVSSIYLIRKKQFFWGAVLISLSTTTRIFGVLLIPLYIIEAVKSKKKLNLLWGLITPLGILIYMCFLKIAYNDPFYFLTSQPIFGAGRTSGEIILLPQVIYRYIKIFLTTNIFSLTFFNAFLEFIFTLGLLTLLVLFVKKMRFSYWLFSVCVLLLPTLSGTFSSMPRYALLSFLLIPYILQEVKNKFLLMTVCVTVGTILVTLFVRGYWVA